MASTVLLAATSPSLSVFPALALWRQKVGNGRFVLFLHRTASLMDDGGTAGVGWWQLALGRAATEGQGPAAVGGRPARGRGPAGRGAAVQRQSASDGRGQAAGRHATAGG